MKNHLNYKLLTSFLVLFCLALFLFFFSDRPVMERFEKLKTETKVNQLTGEDDKFIYNSLFGLRKHIQSDTYIPFMLNLVSLVASPSL